KRPGRSPAKTAVDPPAAPPTADPATTSAPASREPPADAREHPSRTHLHHEVLRRPLESALGTHLGSGQLDRDLGWRRAAAGLCQRSFLQELSPSALGLRPRLACFLPLRPRSSASSSSTSSTYVPFLASLNLIEICAARPSGISL